MSPKSIKLTGKWVSSIAMILSGLSLFIAGLDPSLIPGDYHDLVLASGTFLGALGAFLAHHYQSVT